MAEAQQPSLSPPPESAETIARLRAELAAKDQTIHALRHEKERWRSLTAISVDCYWEQDEQFRLVAISDVVGPVLQQPGVSDRYLGLRRWEQDGVVPLTMTWAEHQAVLNAHQPFKGFEYMQLKGDSQPLYVSVSGVPIFDEKGQFKGYRGSTTDITRRKRLEIQARESVHFLNEVVKHIPLAVHLISVHDGCRIVGWNAQASELFGVAPEEAIGKTMAELELDDAVSCTGLQCDGHALQGKLRSVDDRLQRTRRHGVIRVRSRQVPLSGPDGQVSHVLCTTEDVTERLASQERVRHSEAQYRAVVSALVEAVLLRDASGRIIECNQSTEKIFGKTAEQIRQDLRLRSDWQLLREDGSEMPAEEHPEAIALRTGQAQSNALVRYRRHDGSEMWGLFNVQPLFEGDSSKPSGFVTSLADITTRKLAELEIVQLNVHLENRVQRRTAQLEEANRELEAFSYSVAHDLRSPLGTIDGFCNLLQKAMPADADPRTTHYLARIRTGVHRMGELTNGLLALAKLSRTSLNWESVDISGEVTRILKEHAENNPKHTVSVVVQPALQARGDRALLRQVLENLISNAWKFTSRRADAEIRFGVYSSTDHPPAYFIQDNGAGFDMAYADKLFGTFERLHTPEEFSGSGIGLATVHRIITRHDGRIWAKSAVNQGSTFYFTLGSGPDQIAVSQPSTADAQLPATSPIGAAVTPTFGKPAGRLQSPPSSNSDAASGLELQFSRAFEYAPIGMALVDPDSKRIRVNAAFCRMLGYSEAEMMSKSVHDITHPDDLHWDLLQRQRAVAGEIESYQWEKRYIHQSGRVVWAYLTCSLVRDADRKPIHFLSQAMDITDRKESERVLRESEERFRALTTLSTDWYWEQDEDLRFVRINGDFAASAGMRAEATLGKRRWELPNTNLDDPIWVEHRAQLARRETFRDFVVKRLDEHGNPRYLSVSGTPIVDTTGRFAGYRGVGRDITKLHRITEALRASERQLREITDTVPALITYVDADQRFRFHNRACEEAFARTRDEIDGHTVLEVLGPDTYQKIAAKIDEALKGYPVSYERRQMNARGDHRDYSVSYFPRYGDGDSVGQVVGFYTLANDITTLKRSDRMKSDIIRTVNLELMPSLVAVCGTLGEVCQSPLALPADLAHSVAAAKRDGERVIGLINGLLNNNLLGAGPTAGR